MIYFNFFKIGSLKADYENSKYNILKGRKDL